MQKCVHCLVSGKVQGVWYRGSTQTEARRLGLVGWVKNLPDGRVELLAVGDETRLLALLDWLPVGPPAARVGDVKVTWRAPEQHDDFLVT